MNLTEAQVALIELLAEHKPGWEPSVFYWEPEGQGIRIQEISWQQKNPEAPVKSSGISCIGDDAAPVHFFAERYVLALMFEEDWRIEEARDSLLAALGD